MVQTAYESEWNSFRWAPALMAAGFEEEVASLPFLWTQKGLLGDWLEDKQWKLR